MAALLDRTREETRRAISAMLPRYSEPLPPEQNNAFGRAFARFSVARIVLLGEASHGTSEFYRARAAISRELIGHHGFNIVAVEADWPDAARIDRHVRHRGPAPSGGEAFSRFPTWMWRNAEVQEFVEWLRLHNAALPPERHVSFHGLDLYSLGSSIQAVLDYIQRVDPASLDAARRRYGCLTPWQDEPFAYARGIARGARDTCEAEAAAQLAELLRRRLDYLQADGDDYFDAAQNARLVRAAEEYYRSMYRGARESWNLRDRHMFETLKAILRHRGDSAKAIVWAHNSHIGNAAATGMGWQGEFNIGELCRTAYGEDAALIGFGTDRGTVAAAADWDAPMEIKSVRPARPDSYEHAFRAAGIPRSLTDWRDTASRSELADALRQPLLERAIGVVYRPESELASHYFEAVLAEQFDAYVWFEETRAVSALAGGPPHGAPDTYPFGL